MSDVVLSILIVSHNQKDLLPRCIDSVLGQKLLFPYEIIISDDRSDDGTWELIEKYESEYPDVIRGVKCDSNECDPVNRSERCGWNKANAYKYARGTFFVNIDADDYLKSDDIYQKQVELLIANPDCALCQQRVWQLDEGMPLESGYAWPRSPLLKDGAVLDATTIIQYDLQGLNPTYMIRRDRECNPAEKFGKWFDDTNITLYYFQLGKVVFIDRADYVWVQYRSSISNSVVNWDRNILCATLPLQHSLLFPQYYKYFFLQPNPDLSKVLRKSLYSKLDISDEMRDYLLEFDGFIFQYLANGRGGIMEKIRVLRAFLLNRRMKKKKVASSNQIEELKELLIG